MPQVQTVQQKAQMTVEVPQQQQHQLHQQPRQQQQESASPRRTKPNPNKYVVEAQKTRTQIRRCLQHIATRNKKRKNTRMR